MRLNYVSFVALVAACGGSTKPTWTSSTCPSRADVAMVCWDRGTESSRACPQIVESTRAELSACNAASVTSHVEACELGCQASRQPNETRAHFHMLMTSPPPSEPLPHADYHAPTKSSEPGCPSRAELAMTCWDESVRTADTCGVVVAHRRDALATISSTCGIADMDACELGCMSSRSPNESRQHFHMLMTSPPP